MAGNARPRFPGEHPNAKTVARKRFGRNAKGGRCSAKENRSQGRDPNDAMTYAEAIQFLYGLRMFGTKLGLENTFRLAALAGNPQKQLRFIHVAGTNGKGSTCAMLESIYRASGLRVGLFTSPHLVSFGERLQVDRQPIRESEVVRLVVQLKPALDQFPAEEHPTFFEVV